MNNHALVDDGVRVHDFRSRGQGLESRVKGSGSSFTFCAAPVVRGWMIFCAILEDTSRITRSCLESRGLEV